MKRVYLALLLALPLLTRAQGVGIGTPTPHPSAALDVAATTQGLLLPRLTAAQRAAIAQPAAGLLVFQTDGTVGLYYYNGVSWLNLTSGRVPDAGGATPGGVSTLAGLAGAAGLANGPGAGARFDTPYGVALGTNGTLYVADASNASIRQITAGVVTTLAGLAGAGGSTDGTAAAARFLSPFGIAVDATGAVYVSDSGNDTIRVIR